MATVWIGSARHDEFGKLKGGKAGDQKQSSSTFDTTGEISMQLLIKFIGNRAWYILRPKQAAHARELAKAMKTACNNKNIGYDQNQRNGIVTYGVDSTRTTEADCSSTVRACIKKATGVDVIKFTVSNNFTTDNERAVLEKSGLFEKAIIYRAGTQVYEGDVFVTQTKGHTGICISGLERVVQNSPYDVNEGNYTYKGVNYAPVFNPVYYANKYVDLKKAFGADSRKLFEHFCQFGMKEGRQACLKFNVQIYKERYDDLKAAYGTDLPKYYEHYCLHGVKEGRTAI